MDSTHWERPHIVNRDLVARNLTKKAAAAEPRTPDALRKEYERLEKKQAWMPDAVMKRGDVVRNAQKASKT
eukprot:6757738-Pyramimonas_sp.AAC.1